MPNRLASETSPYLLQHAHNPVDWHPWGPEALERARQEDRPILLSMGYSACHWCHVMERESFEDPALAEVMNRHFVCVKVDREERPDVDQVYMRAVQAMTGSGGWPLTVFLTPEATPFYGGTYFPPTPRHGLPSFRQVLGAAADAFRDRRADVEKGSREIVDVLRRAQAGEADDGSAEPGTGLLDQAVEVLARQYDPTHGGFGRAPKFPQPVTLDVLLRQHARTGDARALQMALTTLRHMADGGIRDHLGGGFHRYSVDERWLVPHFEKMLYDNALLAQAYLDAWRLTGEGDLREVAEDTLDYILADLRSPQGGFYSARDADSEGEEGRFYVWTPAEVEAVLRAEDAALFQRLYDVTLEGNFEGRSILWLPHGLDAPARSLGVDPGEARQRIAAARARLREARSHRPPPFRDEKVLAGWNGLALRALAEAGGAAGRDDFLAAARSGGEFLLREMRRDGTLLHAWKDGTAKIRGFLEDYGSVGNAFLSLYEATLEPTWLEEARWCCQRVLEGFWDPETGLFHDTEHDAESLFLRPRDPMDNATPSGNSLAAELLARAGHLFGEARYTEVARRAVAREAEAMARYPTAFGRLLGVLDRLEAPPVEVVVVGPRGEAGTRALVAAALAPFHRNRTVAGREESGAATAYVCRGYACRAPVGDPAALAEELRGGEAERASG
ncbi:MAG: thioredoxin domain-containing protein [Longimicrobiales bacterium]